MFFISSQNNIKESCTNQLKTCDSGTQYFCKERCPEPRDSRPCFGDRRGGGDSSLRFACSAKECNDCDSGRGHQVNQDHVRHLAGKQCSGSLQPACKQENCDVCAAMRNLNMSNYNSNEYNNDDGYFFDWINNGMYIPNLNYFVDEMYSLNRIYFIN